MACGLLASGVAVNKAMRHSMFQRVDETLVDASNGWARMPPGLPILDPDPHPGRPPSNFFVRRLDEDGVSWVTFNDSPDEPDLPAGNDVGPLPVTVRSLDGSPVRWRMVSIRNSDGDLTTVGFNLRDLKSALRTLRYAEMGIGVAVLLILGLVGYFAVQRSLRPLTEVEKTAAAIAGGNLASRVPPRDPRTEVGRLSEALNGMLAQIQQAVADSDASAEQARESEDRMRRFITDASHELRTPLTTIRGFAELYRQGAAGDVEMLMSRIESESARMGALVEDLLLLAQLDAQRPLAQRRVDLLALAADAVHDAQAVAPRRDITLQVIDGPETPEVIGDEAKLRQVLGNLMANALQHTPEDAGITVRVGTCGADALVEVVDQGPGLSQDAADRVFQRFYRTDVSRTRSSGGTGLGLSIVDSLVRAQGGAVSVTTAPGEGCRFIVRLSRVAEAPAPSLN